MSIARCQARHVSLRTSSTTSCASRDRIKIVVQEWSNSREGLALKLAGKPACTVQLAASQIGWKIRNVFQNNSHMTYTRFDDDSPTGYGVHSKYISVYANFAGGSIGGVNCTSSAPCVNASLVLTGSHNFSDPGLSANDESLVRVNSASIRQAYDSNFSAILAEAASSPTRNLEEGAFGDAANGQLLVDDSRAYTGRYALHARELVGGFDLPAHFGPVLRTPRTAEVRIPERVITASRGSPRRTSRCR